MIFEWVKTTFETLYYWLAFLFDFKSIKATADAFETYIRAAGPNLDVFIENTVKVVTKDAFEKVRGEIEGFFDGMAASLGSQTVGDVSAPVVISPAAKDDPRVRRLAALKESAGLEGPMALSGISDLLTIMPSSCSWLLEKVSSRPSWPGLINKTDSVTDLGPFERF